MTEFKYIGKPITRVDAVDKVTGETVYGYDFVLPDMLYGKVVFSSRAHARIRNIDISRAKAISGVVAIVTGEDAPWIHGETVQDKPFLANEKVRFIGEPIAAVAATDEDAAERAAKLISVESCTMFVGQANGAEITTIEGIAAADGTLHPLQEAFREHHGLQCGFCTPGMITRAHRLLQENPNPTDDEIRFGIAGNLCDC